MFLESMINIANVGEGQGRAVFEVFRKKQREVDIKPLIALSFYKERNVIKSRKFSSPLCIFALED